MPVELLKNQFETLEEPLPGEAIVISVEETLPDIIASILSKIHTE